MGRTIAMEAWKESTVLVISASARLDLVYLEVELDMEAVLVIMVGLVKVKDSVFCTLDHDKSVKYCLHRRWRFWWLQWLQCWRRWSWLLWKMTSF